MVKGFKIDGHFIPISYDTNNDNELQVSELNIWCKANDMKYEDGKITNVIPYTMENIPEKFDTNKYSIENIRKRYPEDRYMISEVGDYEIIVIDQKTNQHVLDIYKHLDGKTYLRFENDKYEMLCCIYDSSSRLIMSESRINNQYETRSPLTDTLHSDICAKNSLGLPTTGKNIGKHINDINKENVQIVLEEYQKKYGTSLISDIFSEYGLSAEERAQYAKHIVDALCQYGSGESDGIEAIKAELYQSIDYEKDKKGMMDSSNIDKLVNVLVENYVRYASILADNLHKDVSAKNYIGLPTTRNTLGKNIKSINAENVVFVMNEYKIQNNGQSLVSDIIEERGLNTNTRKIYIKHIVDAYLTYAKNIGINVNDLEQKFNNEITYQMDKFGFANADYLNVFFNQVIRRLEAYLKDNTAITEPNGEIDEKFSQGNTGDCWLLAAIKAISNSPKGLKILNDSIKVNNDGSVTVTLQGVNKTYTISKEELESNIQFSSGDGDIRALEIAVNKYFEEERGVNKRLDIDGNREDIAYKILIGDKNIDDGLNNLIQFIIHGFETNKKIDDELIESFNDPNKITTVAALGNKNNIQVNADNIEPLLTTDHSYAVLRSDSEYVYLVNPWKSDFEIKITREQFKEYFNIYKQMEL